MQNVIFHAKLLSLTLNVVSFMRVFTVVGYFGLKWEQEVRCNWVFMKKTYDVNKRRL